MSFSEYTNESVEEVLSILKTSFSGLSKREAVSRQKKYGPNEIEEKAISAINVFKRQIKSPFFYLLFFASLISLAIGQILDFAVILFVVLANAAVGFFQEYKAERAVFMLKKFIPQRAKVLRDNKEQIVDKKDLVLGDVVLVETGDTAPADLRIVKVYNFLADESALTGESVPVSKTASALEREEAEAYKAKNIIFAGTFAIAGRAEGIVISSGKETVFGQIVQTVAKEEYKPSSYEKDIFYFSKLVLRIVIITIVIIFLAGTIIKGGHNFLNFMLFSVALIISILPEGLPAVVSFALASGSIKMAKRNVIVRRLSAIERLGNIDVLCTDKTGTLTKNKLFLEKIVSSDKRRCLLYGLLTTQANERDQTILNPFDLALFEKSPEDFWKEYKKYLIVHDSRFNAEKMRSAFIVQDKKGEHYMIVKGAPEFILNICSKISDGTRKGELKEDFAKEGKEGKRVLAIAFKKLAKNQTSITDQDEKGMTFLGYFVFEDALKDTTEEAIKLAKRLGVSIKLITGDSKEVAEHVAKKIKLIQSAQGAISGQELEKLPPEEFDHACEETDVFARVSPQLKYKIVKSLQKRHDVGFLGDGVNDAPALRMANVGIAVEGASDVSKEVSDIVLLKRDLRVIVQGIEDGRNIFANINKYIKCMLASNFGNFYSIAVISLFINYLPMLPIQILLSNLLSDLPLISIVTDTVDLDELKKPKAYHLRSVLPLIINLAIIVTLADFAFFSVFFRSSPATIQTLWFIESVFCELLLVFIIRTKHLSWKAQMPSPALLLSVLFIFIITIALPFLSFGQKIVHFTAPKMSQLLLMVLILVSFMAACEFVKYLYFKYFRRQEEKIFAQYTPKR